MPTKTLTIAAGCLSLALGACGDSDSGGGAEAPSADPPAGAAPEPDLSVGRSSYCQPDPTVGNIDYVIQVKNTGNGPAEGVSIKLVHRDSAGERKADLGDTLVDVNVPANDTKEVDGTAGLDDGEEVTECSVALIGVGASPSDEPRIKVR